MRYNEPRRLILSIRKLFFQKLTREQIAELLGLQARRVGYIITKKRYLAKRERYYRYLVNYAYAHEIQIADMAIHAGVNASSLTRVKRKNKIPTKRFIVPNKRITNVVKNKMVEMYQAGTSAQKVSDFFGYNTSKTVLDVLHDRKITTRTMTDYVDYNVGVFEKIDSHDKAYILGLLYTDGYIIRDYEGAAIQLTISDKYLLQNVATIFGNSAKVNDINCDCKRKKMPNCKDMARLSVYSRKIANDLRKMGVVRNKTYTLSIDVRLSRKYIYSFARGVIDGDGTVGIYNKNSLTCKFSTHSSKFAMQFSELPFQEPLSVHSQQNGMWNVSVIGGRESVANFLRKMYEHKNNLYLERKYAKVQSQIC